MIHVCDSGYEIRMNAPKVYMQSFIDFYSILTSLSSTKVTYALKKAKFRIQINYHIDLKYVITCL